MCVFFLYLARIQEQISCHIGRTKHQSLSVIKTDKKLIGHFVKDSAC